MSLVVGAKCKKCGSEVKVGQCSLPPGRHNIICRTALQVRLAGTPDTLMIVTAAI